MATPLLPDRMRQSMHYVWCVIGGCILRPATVAPVRIGAASQTLLEPWSR